MATRDLLIQCSCANDGNPTALPFGKPANALTPLLQLFFCGACVALKCEHPRCTVQQPEVFFCPCCWKSTFASDALKNGLTCPSGCFECGVCGRSQRKPKEDANDGRRPCAFCSAVGTAAPSPSTGAGGGGDAPGTGAIAAAVALLRRSDLFHTNLSADRAQFKPLLPNRRPTPAAVSPEAMLGMVVDSAAITEPPAECCGPVEGQQLLQDGKRSKAVAAPLPLLPAGVLNRIAARSASADNSSNKPVIDLQALALAAGEKKDNSRPVFATSLDERRKLQAPGLAVNATAAGLGQPQQAAGASSTGPTVHAAIEAAAKRFVGLYPDAAASASSSSSLSLQSPTAGAATATATTTGQLIAALGTRRQAICGSLLSLDDDDIDITVSCRPVQLLALHSRRCLACIAKGNPGILTSPNPAPLQLLQQQAAAAGVAVNTTSNWFRKTSPASALLPRLQLLKEPAAASTAGQLSILRLVNPCEQDVVVVVALLAAPDSSGAGKGGSDAAVASSPQLVAALLGDNDSASSRVLAVAVTFLRGFDELGLGDGDDEADSGADGASVVGVDRVLGDTTDADADTSLSAAAKQHMAATGAAGESEHVAAPSALALHRRWKHVVDLRLNNEDVDIDVPSSYYVRVALFLPNEALAHRYGAAAVPAGSKSKGRWVIVDHRLR